MTAPREWPNAAREARDRAAEEIVSALKIADIALAGETSQPARLALTAMQVKLHKSLRWLESVGAPTRPG